MSRYRRLTIEGGAIFYTLADRGSDLLVHFDEGSRRLMYEPDPARSRKLLRVIIVLHNFELAVNSS
jgi:hypothetical protein